MIWITNQIDHIDPAVKRRFTYSIAFKALATKERQQIWEQVLKRHRVSARLTEKALFELVRGYKVPEAIINQAVFQAKTLYRSKHDFKKGVTQILNAYVLLQNDGIDKKSNDALAEGYRLDGLCLKEPFEALLKKIRRADSLMQNDDLVPPGCGTMLFYGPPGTGKTALARYIAQSLNRACIIKRASDLISPWVGSTEQNIAVAFAEAEAEDAVLVIDEADSFIYSRDIATRSWETTQVNEFLTALEECRTFCICTTNRRENLDSAAIRRFSFKVPFTYAKAEQLKTLYGALLAPLVKKRLPENHEAALLGMDMLAPGDFHAVRSQYWLSEPEELSHQTLIHALQQEQKLKLDKQQRRIGF